jgi:hypothetical protein
LVKQAQDGRTNREENWVARTEWQGKSDSLVQFHLGNEK